MYLHREDGFEAQKNEVVMEQHMKIVKATTDEQTTEQAEKAREVIDTFLTLCRCLKVLSV